jgi:hypothetical protein
MARQGPRFDNQHTVAFATFTALIMDHKPVALFDPFGIQGMLDQAVDLHGNGLGHFSSDDCALAPFNPLTHWLTLPAGLKSA